MNVSDAFLLFVAAMAEDEAFDLGMSLMVLVPFILAAIPGVFYCVLHHSSSYTHLGSLYFNYCVSAAAIAYSVACFVMAVTGVAGVSMFFVEWQDKSAFLSIYDRAQWHQVDTAVVAVVNNSARCCARQQCACADAILEPQCAPELDALQTGTCSYRGHCCEYNHTSCACGGSAVGSRPNCWCDECIAFQTCEIVCSTCYDAAVTLGFDDPFSNTRKNYTKTASCTTIPSTTNRDCLGGLLADWHNGTYWYEQNTASLTATKDFEYTYYLGTVITGSIFLVALVFVWIYFVLWLVFYRFIPFCDCCLPVGEMNTQRRQRRAERLQRLATSGAQVSENAVFRSLPRVCPPHVESTLDVICEA